VGLAVSCLPGNWLFAQQGSVDKCVFEGTARNSVTRLAVGKVAIRLVAAGAQVGYAGSTNAAGAFRFEGILPGDYQVEVDRAGFTREWSLTGKSGRAGSKLRFAPGQTVTGNDLWLTPESAVTGKVLGPDGEPLADAVVVLIAPKWRQGKRVYEEQQGARTDGTGQYRFTGVAPGRYLVYAARPSQGPLAYSILEAPGKPEMRIAGRYHPNAPQLEGAAALEVRAGEEISGIDFRLPMVPVFHLSGKPPAENASIFLDKRNHDQALRWEEERASIKEDGSFDIAGVAPGSYFLYAVQTGRFDLLKSAKVPVTITSQDAAGFVAPPVTRLELKGRVRVEDGDTAEAIPVVVFSEGSEADEYSSMQRRAEPQADGSFAIRDLTPDRYAIRISNKETGKDGGYYLKAVRVNGVKPQNGEIDLTGGPAGDVELILSAGVGSAEGTVKRPEEGTNNQAEAVPAAEPAAELTVVLIPESVSSADTRPVIAYLDPDGHFRVTDLEPGSYRALATTNYDRDLWQNAEFLRQMAKHGAALEVAEKGTARVEVQVVAAAEVRQAEDAIQ
jgi:hypothetical protein